MFHFWKKRQEKNSLIPVVIITAIIFILKSSFLIATSIRGLASMLWIIDDSFIEMKVAENLGHGLGFSLDGIHSTTGAPFLWIYLSSITHMLFGQDGAIKATLILSALLGALACIVVFLIAEKVTKDRRIAWTAFLLATFSGNAFFNAMNGMDTALFTFLVLLSIACALDIGRPKNWSSLAWGCVTGLALGLAVMTRGDGIFIIGSIVCMKCWEYWIAPRNEKHLHLKSLLGILAIAGVCFGIFMIWQLIQTGSPFPGNQIGRRMLQLGKHNFSFEHFSLPRYLTIVAWNVFQLEDLISLASGSALLALVAFVSGSMQQQLKRLSVITFLYLGVFFALLVGYQWYFADLHGLRYINPAVHIFFIYVATLFWRLPSEYMKKCLAIFLILCTIILTQYKFYQLCSRFRWAQYMSYVGTPDPVQAKIFWGTIDWINEHLPPETIVGVRDYGRISMFGDVKIQDLAGNIDPKVAEALENGTLDTYLKELKVEYLYIPSLEQRDEKLYRFLHSRLKLQQVKEAPVSPTQTLYKILW